MVFDCSGIWIRGEGPKLANLRARAPEVSTPDPSRRRRTNGSTRSWVRRSSGPGSRLQEENEQELETFEQASAHWLRHTLDGRPDKVDMTWLSPAPGNRCRNRRVCTWLADIE